MSADFLLELLSEEIPARMQEKACADLARLFTEELAKAGIAAAAIETYVTPRRLALIARDLPLATEAVREERRGPRADAPEQALAGFLKSTGLTRDQLEERADAKGRFLYAVFDKPGRATAEVLAEAIPAIVRGFPWPKSMRWGSGSLRWVRPLQGIVALLGDDVVPFAIDGIVAGAATLGHRFHHPGQITIGNADDYADKLRMCHVILDPAERRDIIRAAAARLAADAGLAVVPDEGLVAENAGLTEWPVPLLGRFDPAFLEVPREVIQLTMRTNQKYFALTQADGRLAPNFICTANIEAADRGAAIAAGNARVLSARLADARFFWEQDLKTPLVSQANKLAGIVFHEKLGTVADKVERVAKLARWLVEENIVTPAKAGAHGRGSPEAESEVLSMDPGVRRDDEQKAKLADMAEQAARLCKADLVTAMVGEFPELQGAMGGYYARAEGLPDEVAAAIRDHYKPVGQGDDVPTAPVTVAVSLADKLDTLLAFFAIEERPTGSKDPFALKRAGLGIISILLAGSLRLPLTNIATSYLAELARQIAFRRLEDSDGYGNFANDIYDDWAAGRPVGRNDDGSVFRRQSTGGKMLYSKESAPLIRWAADWHDYVLGSAPNLLPFLTDRLKVQQREAGVRHDLIDAVFALGGEDDLVRLLARVKALQAFVSTEDGVNLLAGYKRAANILRAEEKKDVAPLPAREGPGVGGERSERSDVAAESQASSLAFRSPTPDPSLAGRGEAVLSYTLEPAEADLLAALSSVEPRAAAAIEAEDFAGAMAALAQLRVPIDRFFDQVTVNDPDPAKRTARLAMLVRIRDAVHRVADFSRIEG